MIMKENRHVFIVQLSEWSDLLQVEIPKKETLWVFVRIERWYILFKILHNWIIYPITSFKKKIKIESYVNTDNNKKILLIIGIF